MSRSAAQRALLGRLQALARDHVDTAANYTRPVSNGPVFRRLLSSVGLQGGSEIAYSKPAESNLSDLATDPNSAVRRVVLAPYGLSRDITALSEQGPQNRQVSRHTAQRGASPYAATRAYVHRASLTPTTLTDSNKTIDLVGSMVTPNTGVSSHFVINRDGLILHMSAIDDIVLGTDETALWASGKPSDILVCYESAALQLETDFRQRNQLFIEAPLTEVQANAIAFVIAKLAIAFHITPMDGYAARANIPRPGFTTLNALQKSAGETVAYRTLAFQDDDELADDFAFVDEVVSPAERQLRLLYGQASSFEGILSRISGMHFDAATDIYRVETPATNEDATAAQGALQQTNTNDVQAFTEISSGYVASRMRALQARQLTDAQFVSLRISEHLVARDEIRAQTLNLALSDDDIHTRTGSGRTPASPGQGELFDFSTGHWTGNGRNVI